MIVIENAEKILANLQTKQRDLARKAIELTDERQQIGFAAHTGDQKARQKLDKLNAAIVVHQSETASLEAAINEAQRRLDAAKHEAALAADREQAHELVQVLGQFTECCRLIDDALADIVTEGNRLEVLLGKINSLGCGNPNRAQLETLGALALHSSLMQTPWRREFRHLAPNQRQSFTGMIEAWHTAVSRNIEQRIGTKQEKAA
jgi:hypothetical protein